MVDVGIFYGHMVYLFGIFCVHSEYFMVVWFIFPRFGMLFDEKSGNPGSDSPTRRSV
jgi:hypothetical protein